MAMEWSKAITTPGWRKESRDWELCKSQLYLHRGLLVAEKYKDLYRHICACIQYCHKKLPRQKTSLLMLVLFKRRFIFCAYIWTVNWDWNHNLINSSINIKSKVDGSYLCGNIWFTDGSKNKYFVIQYFFFLYNKGFFFLSEILSLFFPFKLTQNL